MWKAGYKCSLLHPHKTNKKRYENIYLRYIFGLMFVKLASDFKWLKMVQRKIQIEKFGIGDLAFFGIQRDRFRIQRTDLFLDLVILPLLGFRETDLGLTNFSTPLVPLFRIQRDRFGFKGRISFWIWPFFDDLLFEFRGEVDFN